jgi:fatty acid elongase 3
MYWYYFQSARGIKIWWKQYITVMQIAQFVIDLGFVYFASWDYFTSTYAPWLPHVGTCAGEEFAALSGCAILSSYLVLFISFYAVTYKKGGNRAKQQSNGVREHSKRATHEMEKAVVPGVEEAMSTAAQTVSAANSGLHKIAPNGAYFKS